MGRWQALPLVLALTALLARAQESLGSHLKPASCSAIVCENQTDDAASQPSTGRFSVPLLSGGRLDTATLERLHQGFHVRFHTLHRPRLYAFTATALTNFYARPSSRYVDRFRGAKGFEFLCLGDGRFSLGFETQRVIVFESDRGSQPFRDLSVCNAVGYFSPGSCGSAPFHTNNRTYSFTLRWTLKAREKADYGR